MVAKPKGIAVMLINGGKHGSVRLHPNQKWEVTFFTDDDASVGLEYKCMYLIVSKELFKERFALCF